MRTSSLAAAVVALALAAPSVPGQDAPWTAATPDHAWSFPRDHWGHDGYRNEWWYFTGHLHDVGDPARSFGFQFTLFRIGLHTGSSDLDSAWASRNLLMGHASISDLAGKEHRFSEVLARQAPFLAEIAPFPERPVAWVRAPAGTPGRWTVDWDGEGYRFAMRDDRHGIAFDLATRPAKPLVLQGPNGFSRKAPGDERASLYFSFTRLATEGTMTLDGKTYRVRGTAWMDKEFSSNALDEGQVGWDWFSLRLRDGRDLMLYGLRRADGTFDFRNGTVVAADGTARYLQPTDWTSTASATWTSKGTGATYPARWTIAIPSEGLTLDVVPEFPDQENRSRVGGGLHYWEGAVRALDSRGIEIGEGYVELTGYGEGNRPPV